MSEKNKVDIQEITPGDYDSESDRFRSLRINMENVSPGEMHALIAIIREFCKHPKTMPDFEGITKAIESVPTPKEKKEKAEKEKKQAKVREHAGKQTGARKGAMTSRILGLMPIERKAAMGKLVKSESERGNFYVAWSNLKKSKLIVLASKDEKGTWRRA